MSTIGQSISKADLLQRARDFQAAASANQSIPYQRTLKAENDSFVRTLQSAPDGSLAEIKANALQLSAAAQKKASIASFAGLGLMAAAWALPLPGIAKFACIGAGFLVSQKIGGKAAAEAQNQRYFAGQLGEWQRSLDAQAPSQPAPAPAQPVAAPAQPPAAAPQQPVAA